MEECHQSCWKDRKELVCVYYQGFLYHFQLPIVSEQCLYPNQNFTHFNQNMMKHVHLEETCYSHPLIETLQNMFIEKNI